MNPHHQLYLFPGKRYRQKDLKKQKLYQFFQQYRNTILVTPSIFNDPSTLNENKSLTKIYEKEFLLQE